MYFTGESTMPEKGFVPDQRSALTRNIDGFTQMGELYSAADDMRRFNENANARDEAMRQAYQNRIDAITAATGAKIENPYATLPVSALPNLAGLQAGYDPYAERIADFNHNITELQRMKPDKAGVIRAHVPIEREAYDLAQKAQARLDKAQLDAKDVAGLDAFAVSAAGMMRGMLRDPVSGGTLFVGGGSGAARTIGGRILAQAATDAAINGGAELAVQLAAEKWRKEAGTPISSGEMWRTVGLAAAFGGGIGGLAQGVSEVIKLRGKLTPEVEHAVQRVADGAGSPADVKLVQMSLSEQLDQEAIAEYMRALDEDASSSAVLAPGADPKEVAAALQAIEHDLPLPEQAGNQGMPRPTDLEPGEPPVEPGMFRVYHGGKDAGTGDPLDQRWVSTNRTYAKNYRDGADLHYLDISADDPRITDPIYPDQSAAAASGMTYNFQLTAEESARLKKIERVPEAPTGLHTLEDPTYEAFVRGAERDQIRTLKEEVAANERDIKHLQEGGRSDALPSGRRFDNLWAGTDEARISKIEAELAGRVTRDKAKIAEGVKISRADPRMQMSYAEWKAGPLVDPALKEPMPEAAATGTKPEAKPAAPAKPDAPAATKNEPAATKPEKIDLLDMLPAGTDADGNRLVISPEEARALASRPNDLADVISACKA